MNASIAFPARVRWNAAQLADAVPLQLHELFARYAGAPAGNDPVRPVRRAAPHAWHGAYRCPSPLPERMRVN